MSSKEKMLKSAVHKSSSKDKLVKSSYQEQHVLTSLSYM